MYLLKPFQRLINKNIDIIHQIGTERIRFVHESVYKNIDMQLEW